MATLPVVTLKKGRERATENRHPWIFSGALETVPAKWPPGAVVDICTKEGRFVARGFFNPNSQIAVRVLTFEDTPIDRTFFSARIERALNLRRAHLAGIFNNPRGALRLVFAEADGLPGFIVDRYGDTLAIQCLSAGTALQKTLLVSILAEKCKPGAVFEKSGSSGKNEEGIVFEDGLRFGQMPGEPVVISENGLTFLVDIQKGQKTGFYLDLRDVRAFVKNTSCGKSVLNLGCYTGGCSVAALAGGAENIVSVDSSEASIALLRKNISANPFSKDATHRAEKADMFDFLRSVREEFDLIILDPPAFAQRKKDVLQATKGYKELHLAALKRLRPGGHLVTLCCSHHIDETLFQQIVFYALKDLNLFAYITHRFCQPSDHPVQPFFPEGVYFKGLVIHKPV